MKISILIPHWRTGKMTAYSIAQLLKYKGDHELDIVVIDNNAGDGSTIYLEPFFEHITIVDYPKDRLQSHGIAFDFVLPFINTEYFITTESDSFPTGYNWLNYYEELIDDGVDLAGSKLLLSGGEYIHPCGAMYKKSNWLEAREYCGSIEYDYYESMAMKEDFACHLMVHKSIKDEFLSEPEDYITLSKKYTPFTKELAEKKRKYYSAVINPFHNGMGRNQESVRTYGLRRMEIESQFIELTDRPKIIYRVGYEPGQWLSYWHHATGKKIHEIPTHVKWINDQPGVQQEHTIMQNGFYHLWGISAYKDVDSDNPIAKIKQPIPDQLYETLPDYQKI